MCSSCFLSYLTSHEIFSSWLWQYTVDLNKLLTSKYSQAIHLYVLISFPHLTNKYRLDKTPFP